MCWKLLLASLVLSLFVGGQTHFESLTEQDRIAFALADAQRQQQQQQQECSVVGGKNTCLVHGMEKNNNNNNNNKQTIRSTSYPNQNQYQRQHQRQPQNNGNKDCYDEIGTEACQELATITQDSMNNTCIRLFGAMRHYCRQSCWQCFDPDDLLEMDEIPSLYSLEPQEFVDPRSRPDDLVISTEEREEFWERLRVVDEYMYDQVYTDDDEYSSDFRLACRNRHATCTAWAMEGECDNNPGFMKVQCAPACLSCPFLDYDTRCPFDPATPTAWSETGDLNRMFQRMVTHQDFAPYHPTILSQPNAERKDILEGPWVVILDGFLNETECQTLIDLGASSGYERSEDVGEMQFDGSYGSTKSKERTSTNAWCDGDCYHDPIVVELHQRMQHLIQIPPENFEYLQMLKYEVGQFYGTHHDFIAHDVDRQAGPRILTVFIYLNDLDEEHGGGGTNFPPLNLTVTPKRGRVLLWPSVLDNDPMSLDERTHHQALPVLQGVKYGANAWVHARNFKTPHDAGCV